MTYFGRRKYRQSHSIYRLTYNGGSAPTGHPISQPLAEAMGQ